MKLLSILMKQPIDFNGHKEHRPQENHKNDEENRSAKSWVPMFKDLI